MKTFAQMRDIAAILLSLVLGVMALHRWPFPDENALLALIHFERPALFAALRLTYTCMLFSTPLIALSILFSSVYIFVPSKRRHEVPVLPAYPDVKDRQTPFLVIGEIHHPKRPVPVEAPRWLVIPERGLYTGVIVFGAIGTGKTSGCTYPFAEQLLGYRAAEREKRIGGLVLEVKGDFCHKIKTILKSCGREDDYVEISFDSLFRYNPLFNDLDAYALAYGIATLLNNLYGKGKEPFWQQAYTNLVKFIILLHKVLYDYVTLFDVYECAINPDLVDQKIRDGEALFEERFILIEFDEFLRDRELETYPFERDLATRRMRAPYTAELEAYLIGRGTGFELETRSGTGEEFSDPIRQVKREQFEAVKRWFYHDWKRIEPRLRTSIVEGISVFLSLFDDSPAVKRVFCPPKETYDPVANADGRFGRPLPPFGELIETGAVCALNFPVSANPGLAKVIGTLLKQDFQRAVLNRIPRMEREPGRTWRQVLFLCDEYHSFATVGENDPSGDEKFFALSRQAKCIPVVATQSISSLRSTLPGETWRTLLQTFRTKVFLALSDDFSTRTASDLCGKEEQLKANYTISENGQDAGVSVLTGRATAHRATLSASKGYQVARDYTFEPKVFAELRNAQAIVLAYDGLNPHPPSYCYLKPYYLDRNTSYFEHVSQGAL